jgi:hypothetical protein
VCGKNDAGGESIISSHITISDQQVERHAKLLEAKSGLGYHKTHSI